MLRDTRLRLVDVKVAGLCEHGRDEEDDDVEEDKLTTSAIILPTTAV